MQRLAVEWAGRQCREGMVGVVGRGEGQERIANAVAAGIARDADLLDVDAERLEVAFELAFGDCIGQSAEHDLAGLASWLQTHAAASPKSSSTPSKNPPAPSP